MHSSEFGAHAEPPAEEVGWIEKALKPLEYAKYGLAGAIGATAALHTLDQFVRPFEISGTTQTLASTAGAVLLIVAARLSKSI